MLPAVLVLNCFVQLMQYNKTKITRPRHLEICTQTHMSGKKDLCWIQGQDRNGNHPSKDQFQHWYSWNWRAEGDGNSGRPTPYCHWGKGLQQWTPALSATEPQATLGPTRKAFRGFAMVLNCTSRILKYSFQMHLELQKVSHVVLETCETQSLGHFLHLPCFSLLSVGAASHFVPLKEKSGSKWTKSEICFCETFMEESYAALTT